MNEKYTVYMHLFPNGKKYIGTTSNPVNVRWGKNGNGYREKHQNLIYRAIQKYGWDNIYHIILFENLGEYEAKQLEKSYIEKYKTRNKNFGYNVTKGGDGVLGLIHSEETKQKIGESAKNMWKDDAIRSQIIRNHSGNNNWNYGKHLSEYHRQILSEYAKQRIGDKNHFYGKKHSEDTKKRISMTKKAQNLTGNKNHNSKQVRCIELDKTFESASLAAKWIGASNSTITNACRQGSDFLSQGYHWEYV